MPFKYPSPIERILANSVVDETMLYEGAFCWTWLGSVKTSRQGKTYPRIGVRVRGKNVTLTVHRYIITRIKKRRLSKRQVGMHLCNNTMCVNPGHIVGGTQKRNIRQCVRDGRHDAMSGVNARREQREKQAT